MKNKELLVNLIQQDLKHHQLTLGLDKIGLEGTDTHNLSILELVSTLMNVPKTLQEDWANAYLLCMEEAVKYEITDNGSSLKPLAEVSYTKLKQFIKKAGVP
tara:strand:- start:54 stop:359 length:306 start_codon:yes stop_codon:yes gene_type:complete